MHRCTLFRLKALKFGYLTNCIWRGFRSLEAVEHFQKMNRCDILRKTSGKWRYQRQSANGMVYHEILPTLSLQSIHSIQLLRKNFEKLLKSAEGENRQAMRGEKFWDNPSPMVSPSFPHHSPHWTFQLLGKRTQPNSRGKEAEKHFWKTSRWNILKKVAGNWRHLQTIHYM